MFHRTCVSANRVGVRFCVCVSARKGASAPACAYVPLQVRVYVRARAHASVARTPLWRDCVAALPWLAWFAPSVWTFSCTLSCEKKTEKKRIYLFPPRPPRPFSFPRVLLFSRIKMT